MFDVRNAISTILDRYTLADIVEITLRKYRRDKVTPPFVHRSIPLAAVLPLRKESLRSKRTAEPGKRSSESSTNKTNNHPPDRR
jgi:hypothetical protein